MIPTVSPELQQADDLLSEMAAQRNNLSNDVVQLAAKLRGAIREGQQKDQRIAELEKEVAELQAKLEPKTGDAGEAAQIANGANHAGIEQPAAGNA